MLGKIRVPEDVFRRMTRAVDGRYQNSWVEVASDADGLSIRFERAGEQMEWSRLAYEEQIAAEKRQVRRSVV